jgi:hypothetical protein
MTATIFSLSFLPDIGHKAYNINPTRDHIKSDECHQTGKRMSNYNFCKECEHIKTRMVPGLNGTMVKELSCPARFNPMEGKWVLLDGANPHECPRNQDFMQIQRQSAERRQR